LNGVAEDDEPVADAAIVSLVPPVAAATISEPEKPKAPAPAPKPVPSVSNSKKEVAVPAPAPVPAPVVASAPIALTGDRAAIEKRRNRDAADRSNSAIAADLLGDAETATGVSVASVCSSIASLSLHKPEDVDSLANAVATRLIGLKVLAFYCNSVSRLAVEVCRVSSFTDTTRSYGLSARFVTQVRWRARFVVPEGVSLHFG
jgi:hypothetical protein